MASPKLRPLPQPREDFYVKPPSRAEGATAARSERKIRRDWPSTTFEPLGQGHHFVSLVKCPESCVQVRERGSEFAFRLFVGRPQEVDPDLFYEWAPIGNTTLSTAHSVNVTTACDTEIICGPVPYSYGRIVGSLEATIFGVGTTPKLALLTRAWIAEVKLLEVRVTILSGAANGFTPFLRTHIAFDPLETTAEIADEISLTLPTASVGTLLWGEADADAAPNVLCSQARGLPDSWTLLAQNVAPGEGGILRASWKGILV